LKKATDTKATEIKCPACNGTGYPVVVQPVQPSRKIYPAPCKKCGGKGRITRRPSLPRQFGLLPPWVGLNKRPDAMQKKRRNGRTSTRTSVEGEIAAGGIAPSDDSSMALHS
jgi:hypothetical protein